MKRFIAGAFRIILWALLGIVLFIAGVIICGVKLLQPEVLTPLVSRVANETLDADVSLGKVQLAFEPAFPVLKLKLDSLTVISHALSASDRTTLPAYTDTLFTLRSFRGDVNLLKLVTQGEIALGNVELVSPGLNIVLDKKGRGNFDIYTGETSDEDDTAPLIIPSFSIRRFAFVDPREIRYFNAADSTEASVILFSRAEMDNGPRPVYQLKIDGNLTGPYASLLSLEDISFGLDGKVRWEPERPEMLAVENMTVYGAFVRALVGVELAFSKGLTIEKGTLAIEPVSIMDMLTLVPPEDLKRYHLVAPFFNTDATVGLDARLSQPFRPGVDSIPHAEVEISIPESKLRYGKADIRRLSLNVDVNLRGNDPDSMIIGAKGIVAGPATSLDFSGNVSQIVTDPKFNFAVEGNMELGKLPPVLANLIPGSITGTLDMKLKGEGLMSMLSSNRFHEFNMTGRVNGRNLYFLSEDTAKLVVADGMTVKFASKLRSRRPGAVPVLGANLKVDTAAILINGVKMNISDLHLGAGVENNGAIGDTTVVLPVGGGLKVGRFNVFSITDSAGVRMRGLDGRVNVKRYRDNKHFPIISVDMGVDVMAAGSKDSRLFLRGAKVHASTHKNLEKVKRRAAIKHIADSIQRVHPHLSPDSVMRLAYLKRTGPGHHKRRVQLKELDSETEVIDWDLSNGFRKFLLDWELEGYIRTNRARMLTPYFPLRNRINELDITFSSDSVNLNGIRYRAGNTDMTVDGLISNIRRGLTSTRRISPLKVNLSLSSDTVDVNQIAAAAFAGSAYAHRVENGARAMNMNGDENELEKQIDALVSQHPDSVKPLLVPANIDGNLHVTANNVFYDSLTFKNLAGDILVYGGALNLHDLRATSDAGRASLSALYSAPKADEIRFGLGLQLDGFNIERFLRLVPAVDSVMPLMRDFSGIINANIAAMVDIDSLMNLKLPTLDAAVRLSGDSIAFINPETYRTIGKWLRFRDKADNKIKKMNVELVVKDNMLQLFPFSFDIDRYRLGVLGHNDMAMNFDYHISVLKSPLPFRFGVTIKGNPEKYKIRFGGAKFKEGMAAASVAVVDSARVNLVQQLENVFRRGVSNSRFANINVSVPLPPGALEMQEPVLTPADSVAMIREGILPAPVPTEEQQAQINNEKSRKKKRGAKHFKLNKDAVRIKE